MKLYLVKTFDQNYMFTENEFRDFIEEELRKPDGNITTQDVIDVLDLDDVDPDDEGLKDLSCLSGQDLVEIANNTDFIGAECYEFSNYAYELKFKTDSANPGSVEPYFSYHLQRVVYEDLGRFQTREEAEKYLETYKGLMNQEN